MEAFNGGTVIGLTSSDEYDLLPDRSARSNLLKHRVNKYYGLFDRFVSYNSELRMILSYVRDEVSENWYKTIRGTVIGMLLVRYMNFNMNPQHSQYRGNLVLYSNYTIIQNYLQRTVSVLIHNYGLPNKHYALKFKSNHLQYLSELFHEKMYIDSINMVKHYYKLYPTKIPTTHAQKIIDGKNTLLDRL